MIPGHPMAASRRKPRTDEAVHPASALTDVRLIEGATRTLNSILAQLSSRKRRHAPACETARASSQPERSDALSQLTLPGASALAPGGDTWLVRGDSYKKAPISEDPGGADAPPDFIVLALDRAEASPMNQIRSIVANDCAVPVIVCGPSYSTGWRKMALEAGAFACVSRETPFADQLNVTATAARYRAARLEIRKLRIEASAPSAVA